MASHADIEQVREQLRSIHDRATALEAKYATELSGVHPAFREGARNLVHYLALRKSDTHELRKNLRRLGLSSLAHAERAAQVRYA
jgi:pyruvate kinase